MSSNSQLTKGQFKLQAGKEALLVFFKNIYIIVASLLNAMLLLIHFAVWTVERHIKGIMSYSNSSPMPRQSILRLTQNLCPFPTHYVP
jgi:uncharacterized membrane protein